MKCRESGTNLGAVPQLPSDDWDNEDRNTDIRSDKVGGIPVALQEDGESGHEGDDGGADESHPRGVWLQRALPRQRVAVDTLRLERGIETNVAKGERGPCDQTSNSAEIQKPAEGLRGAARSKT